MIEQILRFLIAYKKELTYFCILLAGFVAGILVSPTCDRDNICGDDIKSKKGAINRLNEKDKEHVKATRKKEDTMKEECDKAIAQALKDNNIDSSELDCLICGGILKQCVEK